MSLQYGELWSTNSLDSFGSLGYPSKFQRVSRLGSVTTRHSSSGRQPNFAALNRGCHHVGHWSTFYYSVFIRPFLFFFRWFYSETICNAYSYRPARYTLWYAARQPRSTCWCCGIRQHRTACSQVMLVSPSHIWDTPYMIYPISFSLMRSRCLQVHSLGVKWQGCVDK